MSDNVREMCQWGDWVGRKSGLKTLEGHVKLGEITDSEEIRLAYLTGEAWLDQISQALEDARSQTITHEQAFMFIARVRSDLVHLLRALRVLATFNPGESRWYAQSLGALIRSTNRSIKTELGRLP